MVWFVGLKPPAPSEEQTDEELAYFVGLKPRAPSERRMPTEGGWRMCFNREYISNIAVVTAKGDGYESRQFRFRRVCGAGI
jgi:hypothetical protein